MLKNQIYKKALYQAPDELEAKILLQAAKKLNISEEAESDWLEYANWIPLLGFFILLRNLLTGNKLSISPALTI
ncbi:MAG: hypothetical protein K8R49_05450 [Candidatus Cloacimonetes bacterium]|nr:hypothetical protein [Candidatus Cloacimonadota bacterium]